MRRKGVLLLFSNTILLISVLLLNSCGSQTLFQPKGPIAKEEISLIIIAFILMLIVVVPVFIMAFKFSVKYKASKKNNDYAPKWESSLKIEIFIWLIPILIIAALSYLTWVKTHELDPYKPIVSNEKTINVDVVSLDWGWLFIYPDQNIAVVNELVFPVKTPLSFKLTSSSVMTSFFIPRLGSQMYAMAGMQTKLHLMADETGTFEGQNQEFSGKGYENMHFKAVAVNLEDFSEWIKKVKASSATLSDEKYEQLSKPKLKFPVMYFSSVDSNLFDKIVKKHRGWAGSEKQKTNDTN